MANEIEIQVSSRNNAKLDQLGRDAKKAGGEVAEGLKKGFREGEEAGDRMRKKVGQDLDKTAQDAKQAGERAGTEFGGGLGDSIRDAISGGGVGGIVDSLTEGIKGSGGLIGAAGVGLATLLVTGFTQSMENQQIAGLLAAQLGATRGEAQRYGRIAGEVYAAGFGDAVGDVRGAVSAVLSTGIVDTKAADQDIKRITELAVTASKVVGVSAQEIADAVRAMLKSGLADNAEQAFDLIVAGYQRGADAGHDMIDVLTSSSVNLHRFGLDGATAIGVLKQAVDGGAGSADSFTGAIEELVGNASDGIPTFERLGLSGEKFAAQLAGGGPRAAAALDTLLDRIRAIEDPAQRSATVVELFGEEATALEAAILKVDPSKAALEMKNFAGATQRASEQIAASTPPIERAWRNLKGAANDAFNWTFAAPEVPDEMKQKMDEYRRSLEKADQEKQAFQERVNDAAHAWENESGAIQKATVSLEKNIATQREAAGVVMNVAQAEIAYQDAIDQAAESLKDNGKTLDINTDKGRANKESLLEIAEAAYQQIEAMEKQGAAADQVRGFMETARSEFVKMAREMGLDAAAANALADKLRLIPGNYTANVGINGAENAHNVINSIRGNLIDLTNRSWVASVAVTGGGRVGGGRYFPGLEHGGIAGGGFDHAAEGGPRGGRWTMVGEHGRELMKLAPGTQVFSNPDTERMVDNAFQGGGGPGGGEWTMRFAGNLDSAFASAFMKLYNNGLIRIGRTR